MSRAKRKRHRTPKTVTPEDRALTSLNRAGTAKTRDLTMWERSEAERTALERLRRLNTQEY